MSKTQQEKQEKQRDLRTPHFKKVCSLPKAIFSPIIKKEHKHYFFVKEYDLVNGQPLSKISSRESDSIKSMSKYRVGDFSIITLDNIGLQSLRPQTYTPDIDAMLANIK